MSEDAGIPEMSFEEAMAKLEELAAGMEAGKQPLENMIADFEKGTALIRFCRSRLDAMQKKVEVLVHDDGADGKWTDFEPETDRRSGNSGNLPF